MKNWIRALLLFWICVFLVSCATNEGRAGLECGAGGAVGAVLACKMAGGSNAKCAAIAAGIGLASGVACSAYSKHLDARRQQLAGKENDLNAQIQYVQGLNADTRQLNAELNKRVTAAVRDTDKVVAEIENQTVNQSQLAQERKSQDELIHASQQEVDKGMQALQTAKDLRARQRERSPDLDAAISQQEQLLADAQQEVDQLSAQRERV
jgi:hypothetical protein